MINHVGFNPPELCVCCGNHYQYRNRLCFDCWIAGEDERADERREREVLERLEKREANG